MTVLLYIVGYIVFSIAFAFFLKTIKIKAKEKKEKINSFSKAKKVSSITYYREDHNDYMNDPEFSYMSCNKYNPKSSFYKKQKTNKNEESQLYVLLKQAEYESIMNPNNHICNEPITTQIIKGSMGSPSYYAYN